MMKSLKTIISRDKGKYRVPRSVRDLIPIDAIWNDGIFLCGSVFTKSYRFSDINYMVASRDAKESMFLTYSELLNSLDIGATAKLTIFNRRIHRPDFESTLFIPMRGNAQDIYRQERNEIVLGGVSGGNGYRQEKYVTCSVAKKNVEEAKNYFSRAGADLTAHFAALDSKCEELSALDRLHILHDIYRPQDESAFYFDARDAAQKGHDVRDFLCPDSMEKHSDYLRLGERYCRVLFLKDYASYIKDDMVTELTDFNRDMLLSIDMIPVPTDEAMREVENRLLGVETNISATRS